MEFVSENLVLILCGLAGFGLLIGEAFMPGIGVAGILAGVTVAHRLVNRMNDAKLKKITYLMIGVSGVINLFA